MTTLIRNHIRKSRSIPKFKALSFFTGLGGLDIGMKQAGIVPLLIDDIDPIVRESISVNYPNMGLLGDISKIMKRDIYHYANLPYNTHIDCIFGGPPCQSFSTIGKRKGLNDIRGNALLQYLRIIKMIRPTYAVIENVRGLLSAHLVERKNSKIITIKGGVLLHIIHELKKADYSVSFNLYNSANFGACEKRERLVLIAKLGSQKVNYLRPTNSKYPKFHLPKWRTFFSAVDGLNPCQHYLSYSKNRLKYVKLIPEGGNWKDLPIRLQKKYMKGAYYSAGGRSGYLRRLDQKKPSPTLVTSPLMKATDLIHPVLNRPLSVEEYKRIQGFPDNWYIAGKLADQYKQIGNAVPIPLGYAIGKCIIDNLHHHIYKIPRGFRFSRYHHTSDQNWKPKLDVLKNKRN